VELPPALTLIPPHRALNGRIAPPGSKSITNRLLLIASLAQGTSHLTGALKSDDTAYMARALGQMGVGIDEPDPTSFEVHGTGRLTRPADPLFLGNAGTATRFLTAAAALVDGPVTLDGDAHMRKRPIAPLLAALGQLGIKAKSDTGCPPVQVRGQGFIDGGRVEIDAGLSSQYVSALLMVAPLARAPVDIVLTGADIGARGYVDLTLAAMSAFGAKAELIGPGHWRVSPGRYQACNVLVEPDASAATYLWAAEKITGGAIDLGVASHAFTQPDARAYDFIQSWPHMPAIIDGAQMQDAIPTLAVIAAFNQTPVRFIGIANLRVKECDRIRALFNELNRIKPSLAQEDGDDLIVNGSQDLIGQSFPTQIETYHDHRIAMSFALAGLLVDGITILNPACVAKTYPGYFDDLKALGVEMRPAQI
jgi:3-phosphoshikimate 1-carboxyvinyltransferase